MIIKENENWLCKVIELKTRNLLRKFKIEKERKFLIWNKEIFYKDGDDDQFQNVLTGRVLKNLHYDKNTEWYQILPHLQVT